MGQSPHWQGLIGAENLLSSCRQASLGIWVKMYRVDRGVVVVPGDEQRSGLHGEDGPPTDGGQENVERAMGPSAQTVKFPTKMAKGREPRVSQPLEARAQVEIESRLS